MELNPNTKYCPITIFDFVPKAQYSPYKTSATGKDIRKLQNEERYGEYSGEDGRKMG